MTTYYFVWLLRRKMSIAAGQKLSFPMTSYSLSQKLVRKLFIGPEETDTMKSCHDDDKWAGIYLVLG